MATIPPIEIKLDTASKALLRAATEAFSAERAKIIATTDSLAKILAALTSSMTPNELRGARGPIADPTLVTVAGTSEAGVAHPMPGVQTRHDGRRWCSTIQLFNAEGESVGVAKWSESMAEWVIFPDPDNPELEKSKADFHREAASLIEAKRHHEREAAALIEAKRHREREAGALLDAKRHHEREAAAARGSVEALAHSVREQTRYMEERDADREAMTRLRRTIDRDLAGALEILDAHGVRTANLNEYATLPLTTMRALRSLIEQIRTECGTAASAPEVVHLIARTVQVDCTPTPELAADLSGPKGPGC